MRPTKNLRPSYASCLIASVLVMGLLLCLLTLTLRQARKDAALISAIRREDARAVGNLLANGADPNAHVLPKPPAGASWRRSLTRSRAVG